MDRKALFAIALCLLVWALWDHYYLAKHRKVQEQETATRVEEQISATEAQAPKKVKPKRVGEALRRRVLVKEKLSEIDGPLADLEFSSYGAGIKKAQLNEYMEDTSEDSPAIELYRRDIYTGGKEEPLSLEITFDPHTRELVCLSENADRKIYLPVRGLAKSDLMGELDPLVTLPTYQLALPFSPSAWREMMLAGDLPGTTL